MIPKHLAAFDIDISDTTTINRMLIYIMFMPIFGFAI